MRFFGDGKECCVWRVVRVGELRFGAVEVRDERTYRRLVG